VPYVVDAKKNYKHFDNLRHDGKRINGIVGTYVICAKLSISTLGIYFINLPSSHRLIYRLIGHET